MVTQIQNEETRTTTKTQYVAFQIGKETYGVDIQQSRGIIKEFSITNVPNTEKYVMGVINLRGQIVPVIDLHERFQFKEPPPEKDRRIITVEVRNSLIGLLVDKVNEVMRVDLDEVEPAPEVSGGIEQKYLAGIARVNEELLLLINLDKLLFTEKETEI